MAAKDLKLKTIAFLGRGGGECAGMADVELLVAGKTTARIQEGHKFLLHTISELVDEQLADAGWMRENHRSLRRCAPVRRQIC